MQGGRVTYSAPMTFMGVMELVERPDPATPLEGNRKVESNRAKEFADYLERDNWVSPGITVRVLPGEVSFQPQWGNGALQWGSLEVPKRVLTRILDGQHRTLGAYIRA